MSKPLPWYFAVNDRPVKMVRLPGGGSDTLVFDWSTGGFVSDLGYSEHVFTPGKDVDQFTEEEFEARVRALREPILERLHAQDLVWQHTGDGVIPYTTKLGERVLTVRVNDFPAEPLYTLLVDGEAVEDLDDWPGAWTMPAPPQALLDKLGVKKDRG